MSFPYDRQWVEKVRQGAERLKQGLMFRVERIAEKKFLDADDSQKKFLLKTQFENLMKDSKVNLSENLYCPYHDDRTPSFKYFMDTKKFYCFARCFEDDMQDVSEKAKVHKDAFDLVGDLFNLKSYDEKYNTLVSWFVENPARFYRKGQGYQQSSGKKKKAVLSTKKSAKNVLATEDPEVKEYLNSRGIDDNMIQLFRIGAFIENGIKLATVSCDNGFETRRNINFRPKDDQDKAGKYLNPKEHSVNLYNGIALKQATTDMPVIIVESTFDAMIIQSLGLLSTALNGVTAKELLKKIEEVKNDELQLILLLDFDNEGERALKRITSQMKEIVKAVPVSKSNSTLAGYLAGYKDIGEAWVTDKQKTELAFKHMLNMVKFGFTGQNTVKLE